MENRFGQTDLEGENSGFRSKVLYGYLALLALLGIVLYAGQWSDKFSEIGLAVFLIFYFVSTALAIWLVRTNKTNSLWADAWKRLFRNKLAVFGLVVIWLIVLFVAA